MVWNPGCLSSAVEVLHFIFKLCGKVQERARSPRINVAGQATAPFGFGSELVGGTHPTQAAARSIVPELNRLEATPRLARNERHAGTHNAISADAVGLIAGRAGFLRIPAVVQLAGLASLRQNRWRDAGTSSC
jgi:hypothetical protein